MTATTNFGTLLKKATTVLGEVVSITPPTVSNMEVEATNLSSTYKEFIAGGLKEVSEFTATINAANSTVCSGIFTDTAAGTISSYSLTFPDSTVLTFNAYPKSWTFEPVNAQGVEALKITVAFRPTGALTLA